MRATNAMDFNYADKMKCPSDKFLQPYKQSLSHIVCPTLWGPLQLVLLPAGQPKQESGKLPN